MGKERKACGERREDEFTETAAQIKAVWTPMPMTSSITPCRTANCSVRQNECSNSKNIKSHVFGF